MATKVPVGPMQLCLPTWGYLYEMSNEDTLGLVRPEEAAKPTQQRMPATGTTMAYLSADVDKNFLQLSWPKYLSKQGVTIYYEKKEILALRESKHSPKESESARPSYGIWLSYFRLPRKKYSHRHLVQAIYDDYSTMARHAMRFWLLLQCCYIQAQ